MRGHFMRGNYMRGRYMRGRLMRGPYAAFVRTASSFSRLGLGFCSRGFRFCHPDLVQLRFRV